MRISCPSSALLPILQLTAFSSSASISKVQLSILPLVGSWNGFGLPYLSNSVSGLNSLPVASAEHMASVSVISLPNLLMRKRGLIRANYCSITSPRIMDPYPGSYPIWISADPVGVVYLQMEKIGYLASGTKGILAGEYYCVALYQPSGITGSLWLPSWGFQILSLWLVKLLVSSAALSPSSFSSRSAGGVCVWAPLGLIPVLLLLKLLKSEKN